MGNVSFSDRFELRELLRDGAVQTFHARERATGQAFDAHFASSLDLLPGVDPVIDRGTHEGRLYVVTTPAEHAPLDSAGAWRIKPAAPPAPQAAASAPPADPAAAPGDFTRMFQLRQAPEPVASPVLTPVTPPPATSSQPGEFTRAFQRPAAAPSAAPVGSPAPGQPGEFTRMFQKPVTPLDNSVPAPPARASQPRGVLLVIAILVLSAIAVFVVMRRLY